MMGKIPLRAEDADRTFLRFIKERLRNTVIRIIDGNRVRIVDYHYQTPKTISKYVKEEGIIEVLAPKGVGKTLCIYLALNELWEKHGLRASGIYFDPVTGDISVIDSSKFCDDDEFNELSPRERVREADVVVVDNWHYVADIVSEGYMSKDILDALAKETLEELEVGKKVIIVTESPIRHYHNLGFDSYWLSELVDVLEHRIEVTPPDLRVLKAVYGVKMDETMERLWEKYSDRTPRTFVNLVNEFGKVITYDLFEYKVGKLDLVGRFILKNPILPRWIEKLFERYKIVKKIPSWRNYGGNGKKRA